MNNWLIILFCAVISFEAKSSSLPPLGDRVYLLKPEFKYDPVDIVSGKEVHEHGAMRDPEIGNDNRSSISKSHRQYPVQASKQAKLIFSTVKVKGRKLNPSLRFRVERLELQVVTEMDKLTFHNKVSESFEALNSKNNMRLTHGK